MNTKEIFSRKYDDESLIDVQEHIIEAIENSDLPCDKHGFTTGRYTVTVIWQEDSFDNDES